MTHFVGIGIIPSGDIEINPDYDHSKMTIENMFEMGEAGYSLSLEEMLAPYNEQDDNYCEKELQHNESNSAVLTSYLRYHISKDEKYLDEVNGFFDRVNSKRIEHYKGITTWDMETKESKPITETEVLEKTKELEEVMVLMQNREFSFSNTDHKEMFIDRYGDSSLALIETTLDEDIEKCSADYYDQFLYNPQAKWDWWVIGGRWDKMIEGSNILADLNELLEKKIVPFKETLPFFQAHALESEGKLPKTWKKDDEGKYLEDSEGRHIPDEYYTDEELNEPTEIPKYGFCNIISEKFGWVEETQFGWFGMSAKDSESPERQREIENEWEQEKRKIVEHYARQKDENGLPLYVGVVVDFHI